MASAGLWGKTNLWFDKPAGTAQRQLPLQIGDLLFRPRDQLLSLGDLLIPLGYIAPEFLPEQVATQVREICNVCV